MTGCISNIHNRTENMSNEKTTKDDGFTATVNGENYHIPGYLEMSDEVKQILQTPVRSNGCGSTGFQTYMMRTFQKMIRVNLRPACIIHDIYYGNHKDKSRSAKVRADAELHINLWRLLIRGGTPGWKANMIVRLIHVLLIVGGSPAFNA